MMKRTVIFAALIVMSASPAMAQRWAHLGSDGAGNHFFYNPKTFNVTRGNIVSSWTKKEFGVDTDVMAREKLTPDMYKGSKTISAFEKFDCQKKKKKTLIGKIFESGIDKEEIKETGWIDATPGSMDESLLNALCREGEKKKESDTSPKTEKK